MAHPDGSQAGSDPEEEDLARHQSDADQSEPSASGASDVAHPGATAAAELQRRRLADADVGKLADLAQDVQALGASLPKDSSGSWEPEDAAVEPCTQGADQSAARSCAAQAVAADRQRPAELAVAEQPEPEDSQTLKPAESSQPAASPQEARAQRVEPQYAALLPPEAQTE